MAELTEEERKELERRRRRFQLERSAGQPPAETQQQEPSRMEGIRSAVEKGVDQYMKNAEGILMGAADPFVGGAQLVANLTGFGDETMNNYVNERENKRFERRGGSPILSGGASGPDWARIGGNIGTGAALTKKIPGLRNPASTAPGRIGQGMFGGGLFAGTQPTRMGQGDQALNDYWEQKAFDTVIGSLIGGGVTSGVEGLRAGYRTFGGAGGQAEDIIRSATDDPQQVARNVRRTGDVRQGVGATNTEGRLAGLTRNTTNRMAPNETLARDSRVAAQRMQQLRSTLDDLGPDETVEGYIGRMEQVRESGTRRLYAEAARNNNPVALNRTPKVISSLMDKWDETTKGGQLFRKYDRAIHNIDNVAEQRPTHIRDIRARSQGADVPRTNMVEVRTLETRSDRLVRIARELNDDISNTENREVVRELMAIKRALDHEIGLVNPAHKKATQEFARLSRPVDQGRIVQVYDEALSPALARGADESVIAQSGNRFSTGLRNQQQTVKKATGFKKNQGLQQYFNEDELATFDDLADQLGNEAQFNTMATRGSYAADDLVSEATRPAEAPHVLNRLLVMFNHVMTKGGSAGERRTAQEMARILQDPDELIRVMENLDEPARQAMRVIIRQAPTMGIIANRSEGNR